MYGYKGINIIKPVIQYLEIGTHTIIRFNWPEPPKEKAKILLIHGLGEHIGRYNNLASSLYQAGYSVIAYDQYGHGLSTGSRGDIDCEDRLTEDLKKIILTIETKLPIVLLGHSLGGLVVQRVLAENPELADAAIMSSPAFAVYTTWIDKLLIYTLSKWFAHFKVDNKIRNKLALQGCTNSKRVQSRSIGT
jgi:alpha-beta hydrolase superfamily lysophospholipase